MITNPIHQKIIKEISQMKSVSTPENILFGQRYIGTDKPYHGFTTKQITDLAKKIFKENQLNSDDIIQLLNSLYQQGTSYTEIVIGPMILSLSPQTLKNFDPKNLDLWLNYTHGWAENDVLCQSNYTADILLNNWSEWQKILKEFNQSSNINKRRASLVLLTKPLRQSDDPRLSKLAFANVEHLKGETDILITKAVSWILRSLVSFHKDEVLKYLEDNKDSLPKIAYRETLSKALTGRKYNNSKKQK
jgi:3-methyladenine DNA glycosylase AlkD